MAQLAVAWVLQNDNVASAIIGASRPEQVTENVAASGAQIPAEALAKIETILGDAVVRDPSLTTTSSPTDRPS
jgi:aryl-alcohol dehydrogenase-like predicted oxidoreductase